MIEISLNLAISAIASCAVLTMTAIAMSGGVRDKKILQPVPVKAHPVVMKRR